jgi:hypothetical protein
MFSTIGFVPFWAVILDLLHVLPFAAPCRVVRIVMTFP